MKSHLKTCNYTVVIDGTRNLADIENELCRWGATVVQYVADPDMLCINDLEEGVLEKIEGIDVNSIEKIE